MTTIDWVLIGIFFGVAATIGYLFVTALIHKIRSDYQVLKATEEHAIECLRAMLSLVDRESLLVNHSLATRARYERDATLAHANKIIGLYDGSLK